MPSLEKASHFVTVFLAPIGIVATCYCAYASWIGLHQQKAQEINQGGWSMLNPHLLIAIFIVSVVIGAGCVAAFVSALWARRTNRKSNEVLPVSFPSVKKGDASELPTSRPKIYPAKYGGTFDNRYGLFIRNDGEAAFDVTVHDIPIGTAKLKFWSGLPVLTADKGETLMEGHIEIKEGSGTFANALMSQMVKADLAEIPVNITYKDAENNWYVTECVLERDVMTRGSGIAVKFVSQKRTDKPKPQIAIEKVGIGPAPDVALVWELSDDKKNLRLSDPELEKDILIHNRSGKYVYNVQVLSVPLHQELTFDLINEIEPGKYHPTLGRWNGASSLTTKWAYYFCNQNNADSALKRGWVFDKTHPRGLSDQFLKLPMSITYECEGVTYKADFEFVYDIGDESHFLKKSAGRM